MNTADWIVIAILLLWAVLAVRHMIKRKKSGKCLGCSGCCEHCRHIK